MDADKSVTVNFKSVATRKITATAPANGSIQGAGLNCGATCSAPQTTGSKPSVVAAPATGYQFASWGGDCANQGQTCSLDMSADRAVTATFKSVGTGTLTVRLPGGDVTVTVTDATSYLRGPSVLLAHGELADEWWNSLA